jgi:hypothetical protein
MCPVPSPQRPLVSLEETIATIDRLVQGGRPLLLGPWLGEVGYEALYWLPFLAWVVEHWSLPPERLIALSRGGVASWYAPLAARYVEQWSLMPLERYVGGNQRRGSAKQHYRTGFDDDLIHLAVQQAGLSEFDVLHPSLIYNTRVWRWPAAHLQAIARYQPLTAPRIIDPALLPRRYVAMKLYHGDCLPDTSDVRRWLRDLVATTAAHTPVILLDTGLDLRDGHRDYLDVDGAAISARPWMTARNNLGVQTQIIAGAHRYIGPRGGISWLAPRLGVDTTVLAVPECVRAKHHTEIAVAAFKAKANRLRLRDPRTLRSVA